MKTWEVGPGSWCLESSCRWPMHQKGPKAVMMMMNVRSMLISTLLCVYLSVGLQAIRLVGLFCVIVSFVKFLVSRKLIPSRIYYKIFSGRLTVVKLLIDTLNLMASLDLVCLFAPLKIPFLLLFFRRILCKLYCRKVCIKVWGCLLLLSDAFLQYETTFNQAYIWAWSLLYVVFGFGSSLVCVCVCTCMRACVIDFNVHTHMPSLGWCLLLSSWGDKNKKREKELLKQSIFTILTGLLQSPHLHNQLSRTFELLHASL